MDAENYRYFVDIQVYRIIDKFYGFANHYPDRSSGKRFVNVKPREENILNEESSI